MELKLLIKKCLQNDRKAQFELFDQYVKQISLICERYGPDLPTAKDNVQKTFIKIFKNLASFNGDKGNFGAWIKRIAINECLMTYRKNKRLVFLENEDLPNTLNVYLPDFGSNIDFELLLKEIGTIPLGYRTIFMLSVVEGYSHREISAQLGITESTSRTQLFKARKILMNKFGNSSNLNKVS